jgi:hypothetical protein
MSHNIPNESTSFASIVLLWNVSPLWEDLLRAAIDDFSKQSRIVVRTCLDEDDVQTQLSEDSTVFIIVEWDAQLDHSLQVLHRLARRYSKMRFVVLVHQDERGSSPVEREAAQVAREMGAVLAVNSTSQLPQLLDVIQRHAELTAESPRTLIEDIESSIPWTGEASLDMERNRK